MTATSVAVQGQDVRLPVVIRHARVASATYVVPTGAAQELVAPSGLRVASFGRGRTLCVLGCVKYLDGDLGPYNEVMVALTVEPPGAAGRGLRRRVETYIHRLPVNQTFTLDAGRRIWGFPKFLTDSTITGLGGEVRCDLGEDGEPILTLRVARSPVPLPGRSMTMGTWSYDDGVLRRTPFRLTSAGTRGRPGGAALTLGPRHPMAAELRSLGLPRRALFSSTVDHMEATFEAPVLVTPAEAGHTGAP